MGAAYDQSCPCVNLMCYILRKDPCVLLQFIRSYINNGQLQVVSSKGLVPIYDYWCINVSSKCNWIIDLIVLFIIKVNYYIPFFVSRLVMSMHCWDFKCAHFLFSQPHRVFHSHWLIYSTSVPFLFLYRCTTAVGLSYHMFERTERSLCQIDFTTAVLMGNKVIGWIRTEQKSRESRQKQRIESFNNLFDVWLFYWTFLCCRNYFTCSLIPSSV